MGFPVKIAAIYAVFSILWITLSDQVVDSLFSASITQTYQGWGFIFFSSLLILVLLTRELQRRNRAEEKLARHSQQLTKLSQAMAQSPVSIIITEASGTIEYVNDAFVRISGFSREEALGQNPRMFHSDKTPSATYEALWTTITSGQPWEGELMNQRKDKTHYWVKAGISPVKNDDGEITHFLAIEEDISMRKSQEHKIKHQANYDSLTELPNRFLAMDRMSQAINSAIRHDQTVVVMFIDLDDFKQINESEGRETGDNLITLAASRIRETVRQTDTVARYGGDEFLVVLSDLESPDDASRVAEKVLSMLAAPFQIEGRELCLTASIGMALFPNDGQDPYELLRNADEAMFGAKDDGGNCYEYYSSAIKQASAERMQIEQRLRQALTNQELSLHYQPLLNADNKIVAAEALLRWDNPELGSVAPERFIPLAEATGLILPIGNWVIETAMAQLKRWRNAGQLDIRLSINLTPRQFIDPGLTRLIQQNLDLLELPGEVIELEITESLFARTHDDIEKPLRRLRQMGVRIALDDFGSGASSLNHLKNVSLDTLKIDHRIVKGLQGQPKDQALVKASLSMAKELGLTTVGEGVETDEQLALLRGYGIEMIQGYLYSPALPASEFERFYNEHNR